jgi:hypothetical protein
VYTLIPEHVFFVIDQERRQRLVEGERARLLRQGDGASSSPHTWARPLARAWNAATTALTGLIRIGAARPVQAGGEETPAGV